MQQPAERMTAVPKLNISSKERLGKPSAAIHRAPIVGHSSNRIPIGLSRRVSCTKAGSLPKNLGNLARNRVTNLVRNPETNFDQADVRAFAMHALFGIKQQKTSA